MIGSPNHEENGQVGLDGEVYVPVYCRAADRVLRNGSKTEYYAKSPYTAEPEFTMCSNHAAGIKAGKK